MQKSVKQTIFMSLATTILAISAIVVPMQTAKAQGVDQSDAIVRVVGNLAQQGLANVAVVLQGTNIAVGVSEVLSGNQVQIPIVVNANVPVTLCAIGVTVLGETNTGGCRNVGTVDDGDVITIPFTGAPQQSQRGR